MSENPSEPPIEKRPPAHGGLCPTCVRVQRIVSGKGSAFLLCTLSKRDLRFPKYPPQPVLRCAGFEPAERG